MSKLACHCGHIIRDQTDLISYKAEIIKDQDVGYIDDKISEGLAELVKLSKESRRSDWINKYLWEGYPLDEADGIMIFDYISSIRSRFALTLYECERCGSLWVQENTKSKNFISFSPASEKYESILSSDF